ncbi:VirB4 family type IV secretion/conjugal transfer ATPase, partial [Burkholderia cenocepacia]|nr:VirB4 family type IV secretion/conjugal transfer ATPase [Burkholderia cenocepacia]MDR5668041.1 VirB4 family type IV secretion/conjugal transfer ATPase [Burkholderia cenocepacia]
REGDYIQIWKVPGIAFETADPADILARHVTLNQLVRNLPGGHVALWTHRLRRRTADRFETTYLNRFCQDLAERYYASFAGYTMMTNELYVSAVYRPHRTRLGRLFSRAARRTPDDIQRDQQDALRALADIAAQIETG